MAPNRDDADVLIILTAREMNKSVHIVAGGREQENLHLLRQGGADEVIDATAAVGRMLGLGAQAPDAVQVLDDLLGAGSGLELVELDPEVSAHGHQVPAGSTLVAIIRARQRLTPGETRADNVQGGDRVVVLRDS